MSDRRERAVRRARDLAEPAIDRIEGRRAERRRRQEDQDRRDARRALTRRHRRPGLRRPWRTYVDRARRAYEHLVETVEQVPDGPLRDRLLEVEDQVATAVDACATAAGSGATLATRHAELVRLLPTKHWRRGTEADAVASSRAAVQRLDDQVQDVRRQLSEQSLAMVKVCVHALDLLLDDQLDAQVESFASDLIALQESLDGIPSA